MNGTVITAPAEDNLLASSTSTDVAHGLATNIIFDDVSKFYGEVLGINRVNLEIPPGITSLVGPNGSGKSTLMNLMTGLLQPSAGQVSILGRKANEPEEFFRLIGYCAQYDSFPPRFTGRRFVESGLEMAGLPKSQAAAMSKTAIERVGLTDAAGRRVAGYSKGMRQRIRLARAIAMEPAVLILDEPLNGLDPMARAEVIELFKDWADQGQHLIISSHILHEVDMLSDRVILMNQGYVVAEGDIRGVRGEMDQSHPKQIMLRCDRPHELASRLVAAEQVTEVQIHEDGGGLHLRSRSGDELYALLSDIVIEIGISIETVKSADDDVEAVYEYLIEGMGESA